MDKKTPDEQPDIVSKSVADGQGLNNPVFVPDDDDVINKSTKTAGKRDKSDN